MRKRRWARSVAVVVSITLFASSSAWAEDIAPQQLLTRMSASLRSLDFQGSFIYEHDGRVDALRVFHFGGERERERLVSLTGPRGEIVRDDRTVTCVQSGSIPTLFANRPGYSLLPLVPNVRELGAQYSVSAGGEDRVAGYVVRVVDIAPRDQYRYGYRLWLQQDTQLPLRSAILDAARRPLEQFMFVALDVGAKPSETDLLPGQSLDAAVSPAEEEKINSRPRWTVPQAPAGFRLVRTQRPPGSNQSEHLVYTDGIASVSIYVEPRADTAQTTVESASMRGALSIHSRSDGALRITALGDVPPATVKAMALGVRANGAAD
jgi:sigma-E factor negative regulatory protein RseB